MEPRTPRAVVVVNSQRISTWKPTCLTSLSMLQVNTAYKKQEGWCIYSSVQTKLWIFTDYRIKRMQHYQQHLLQFFPELSTNPCV
jgi:hypothetical protein